MANKEGTEDGAGTLLEKGFLFLAPCALMFLAS